MANSPIHIESKSGKQEAFTNALASLCAKEVQSKDADRISNMIERLSHSIGMTVALSSGGDPKAIASLISGCEAYMFESATDWSGIAQLRSALSAARHPLSKEGGT